MLIIIDARIPKEAKKHLSTFGNLLEFSSQNITYPAISCHPDIFFCQTPEILICAPNTPSDYLNFFNKQGINYQLGINNVGFRYPETAHYNCLVDGKFIFHKKGISDPRIIEYTKQKHFMALPQGYSRCSMLNLPSGAMITSDKGIEKNLKKANIEVHYFSPTEILLPDMKHGFIGGTLGLYQNKVFAIGNPKYHSWGNDFTTLITNQGLELISLYDGPFIDGGGIFFLES